MEQQRFIHDCCSDFRHIHLPHMGVLRPFEKTDNGLLRVTVTHTMDGHVELSPEEVEGD